MSCRLIENPLLNECDEQPLQFLLFSLYKKIINGSLWSSILILDKLIIYSEMNCFDPFMLKYVEKF